jgi:hypothetical protein
MDEREPSSASIDARRSFTALRRHALVLAELSASFAQEASEVTAAYRQALDAATGDAWSRLVVAAFRIARHGADVEELLGLREPERGAWRFFQQIADENADLLITGQFLATA